MTLKALMEELKGLRSDYMNLHYSDEGLCLADMAYAIAAASKNLTASDVVAICKEVMKDYKQTEEEEEDE